MSNYWEDRARPVLDALHATDDPGIQDGILFLAPGGGDDALGLGLSVDALHDTILQLADAGYVEVGDISYYSPGGASITGLHVTGRGLQVLGEWPRFDVLVSPVTLAGALERLAEYAPASEAVEMRQAAEVVRRMGGTALKSLALGAGGALLRHALGLP